MVLDALTARSPTIEGLVFVHMANQQLPQTIFKIHREERDRWTQVINETVRDERLSFKATGVLVYLLSLPPDWSVCQQHISRAKKDGKTAVGSAFKELMEAGYMTKQLNRVKGRIVATIWNVYEKPVSPLSGFLETDKPKAENPPLRSTQENEILKSNETPIVPKGTGSLDELEIPENLNNPVFKTFWSEWKQYRAERKSKLTPTTARKQLLKLSKAGKIEAIKMLERSMENGWIGIFDEKPSSSDIRRSQKTGPHSPGHYANNGGFGNGN